MNAITIAAAQPVRSRRAERYGALFGTYTPEADFATLWHRFEPDSIESAPAHVAAPGFQNDRSRPGRSRGTGPIETIETRLSDEQIWASKESNSILYCDH